MKLLVLASILAAGVYAKPQVYSPLLSSSSGFRPTIPGFSSGGSSFFDSAEDFSSSSIGSGFSSDGSGYGRCSHGQVRNVDGRCVTPQITRNLYVYTAPPVSPIVGPRPYVPPPRIEHNVVFIHTPDQGRGQNPIVIPPPRQKNIVYVLSKRPEYDQRVVHVPTPKQQSPEVYFVNYADGDNPILPTGGDLQSALTAASPGGGQVLGSSGGIFGGGIVDDGSHEVGLGSFGGGGFTSLSPSSLYTSP